MAESDDEIFMRRCIELASKAEGLTYPNPLVGSVITCEGRIIGEGYHLKAGAPHAEVCAIASVGEKELLKKSNLYVNLEPCSHYGRTPPCADLIISTGIPRVVAGTTDTSSTVSGSGFAKLRSAGCKVVTGILEEQCRRINRRFFTFHEKKRPYITFKWAQSSDGFIDIERIPGSCIKPAWITGDSERVLVHKWRSEEEAILVGANTLRNDSPRLNVREWTGANPLKIILSRSGLFDCSLIQAWDGGPVVLFTSNRKALYPGVETVFLGDSDSAALRISEYLFNRGIQSLFVEGGAKIIGHFISENVWDEARIFTGKSMFRKGVRAPEIKGTVISQETFSESSCKIILNNPEPIG
jgi:diaminohydroxyphosphoribosylaminopyrimidine deaminase/5-amino-6-(5-phosphoribosylamino)uracil reductase